MENTINIGKSFLCHLQGTYIGIDDSIAIRPSQEIEDTPPCHAGIQGISGNIAALCQLVQGNIMQADNRSRSQAGQDSQIVQQLPGQDVHGIQNYHIRPLSKLVDNMGQSLSQHELMSSLAANHRQVLISYITSPLATVPVKRHRHIN